MASGQCDSYLSAIAISGRWCALRPLNTEADAQGLFTLSHGKEAHETWADMKVGPFENEQSFVEHVKELTADESRAFFAIIKENTALGWMCLMEARPKHQVVELGYVLFTPQMQCTPMGTEGFYLLLRHCFEDLGFRRVEWTCMATNSRSRRCADRLGFVFEGTLRKQLVLKGLPRDICMYSMLSEEWVRNKPAFDAWLASANFQGGLQIKSLGQLMRSVVDQPGE
jgi:RimJ/RimL family protein N-acetyltransferase